MHPNYQIKKTPKNVSSEKYSKVTDFEYKAQNQNICQTHEDFSSQLQTFCVETSAYISGLSRTVHVAIDCTGSL